MSRLRFGERGMTALPGRPTIRMIFKGLWLANAPRPHRHARCNGMKVAGGMKPRMRNGEPRARIAHDSDSGLRERALVKKERFVEPRHPLKPKAKGRGSKNGPGGRIDKAVRRPIPIPERASPKR